MSSEANRREIINHDLETACRFPYDGKPAYNGAGCGFDLGSVYWARLAALAVCRDLCDRTKIKSVLAEVEPSVRELLVEQMTDLIAAAQEIGAEY